MNLIPKIPRGSEDETGFHLVDDPSRDYSFMDETRARIAREWLTVVVVVIIAGIIAFGVLYFSKTKTADTINQAGDADGSNLYSK